MQPVPSGLGRELVLLVERPPVLGEPLAEVRRLEDLVDDGAVEHQDGHVRDQLDQDELAPEHVERHVVVVPPQSPELKGEYIYIKNDKVRC